MTVHIAVYPHMSTMGSSIFILLVPRLLAKRPLAAEPLQLAEDGERES